MKRKASGNLAHELFEHLPHVWTGAVDDAKSYFGTAVLQKEFIVK